MKIENKAPDMPEIVISNNKYVTSVSRTPDGRVHVMVVSLKDGSHQHYILGELRAI